METSLIVLLVVVCGGGIVYYLLRSAATNNKNKQVLSDDHIRMKTAEMRNNTYKNYDAIKFLCENGVHPMRNMKDRRL